MNFKRLYYENPYLDTVTTEVQSCQAWSGGDGLYAISLDPVIFYPEGGGQPGDQGWLDELPVWDTQLRDEEVVVLCREPLIPGTEVLARVDFPRRFSFMQQHTADHLLSGLAHQQYGVENVGFHINEELMTIDYDQPLSDAALGALENQVNQLIFQDLPVTTVFPERGDTGWHYRSKKELTGDLRLIRIEEIDLCACCGLHVSSTGQIGSMKIVHAMNYKGGVRLTVLAGDRALHDYQELSRQAKAISQAFSLPDRELMPGLAQLQAGRASLEEEVLYRQRQQVELLHAVSQGKPLLWFDPRLTKTAQKQICKWAVEQGQELVISLCPVEGQEFAPATGFRYILHAASGDLARFQQALETTFPCRGGGRGSFYQGQVEADADALIALFTNLLEDIYIFRGDQT